MSKEEKYNKILELINPKNKPVPKLKRQLFQNLEHEKTTKNILIGYIIVSHGLLILHNFFK